MSPTRKPRGERKTGSPQPGEPVYLAVGRIRRPHGVQGEIIVTVLTDFPERLRPGKMIFLGPDYEPHQLLTVRQYNNDLLVSFKGFETPEETGVLRNQMLYIEAKDLPRLPEGEYYHHELIGMSVLAEDGKLLGVLNEIVETGANDVYVVVTPEGEEMLVPAIQSVLLSVDLESREMRIRPQEYL